MYSNFGYVNCVKYGVLSGPYFPVFGLNTEIYGVNWTLGHFSRSGSELEYT